MRAIAVLMLCAVVVAGCDDPAQPKPLDRRLVGKRPDGPPPVPKALAPKPAPPTQPAMPPDPVVRADAGAAEKKKREPPTDEALAGPFAVRVHSGNGLSMYDGRIELNGDADGGTVTQIAGGRRSAGTYFKGTLDGEKTRAIIAELKRLRFWEIENSSARVRDATGSNVSVRMGTVDHSYTSYGGCDCIWVRPTEPQVPCSCPGQELISLVERSQRDATPVTMPKVKVGTFNPSPRSTVKFAGDCELAEHDTFYTCRSSPLEPPPPEKKGQHVERPSAYVWCRLKRAKTYACFESPWATEEVDFTVTNPPGRGYDAHGPAAACVLASGAKCHLLSRQGWSCDRPEATVRWVLAMGTSWVAMDDLGEPVALKEVYFR